MRFPAIIRDRSSLISQWRASKPVDALLRNTALHYSLLLCSVRALAFLQLRHNTLF